jgi:hypothetical protein
MAGSTDEQEFLYEGIGSSAAIEVQEKVRTLSQSAPVYSRYSQNAVTFLEKDLEGLRFACR